MSKRKKKTIPKFKLIKQFKTSKKVYEIGDYFETDNIKVIEFLKTNKFI